MTVMGMMMVMVMVMGMGMVMLMLMLMVVVMVMMMVMVMMVMVMVMVMTGMFMFGMCLYLCVCVWIFALTHRKSAGTWAKDGRDANYPNYFNTFVQSAIRLYTLLTTVNFPDVMLPGTVVCLCVCVCVCLSVSVSLCVSLRLCLCECVLWLSLLTALRPCINLCMFVPCVYVFLTFRHRWLISAAISFSL